MSWTKKQLINAAFEEIGIGSYQFDIQPEMYAIGLNRLDGMIGTWIAQGINFNYPMSDNPNNSGLEDDSGIPDFATEATYQNLAIRLAPIFGKVASPDLKQAAYFSFKNLLNKTPEIPSMQLNNTIPAGSGNKLLRAYWTTLSTPETRASDGDNELVDYN